MAQITINIPDAKLQDVLTAWATEFGRPETINGQPNPETKQQFFRRTWIEKVHEVTVKNYNAPSPGIT